MDNAYEVKKRNAMLRERAMNISSLIFAYIQDWSATRTPADVAPVHNYSEADGARRSRRWGGIHAPDCGQKWYDYFKICGGWVVSILREFLNVAWMISQ